MCLLFKPIHVISLICSSAGLDQAACQLHEYLNVSWASTSPLLHLDKHTTLAKNTIRSALVKFLCKVCCLTHSVAKLPPISSGRNLTWRKFRFFVLRSVGKLVVPAFKSLQGEKPIKLHPPPGWEDQQRRTPPPRTQNPMKLKDQTWYACGRTTEIVLVACTSQLPQLLQITT